MPKLMLKTPKPWLKKKRLLCLADPSLEMSPKSKSESVNPRNSRYETPWIQYKIYFRKNYNYALFCTLFWITIFYQLIAILDQSSVDRMLKRGNASMMVGASSWKDQFLEAFTVQAGKSFQIILFIWNSRNIWGFYCQIKNKNCKVL